MMNSDYVEVFKNSINSCPGCGSKRMLLFVETRIQDCVAWACADCFLFQVNTKGKTPEERAKVINEFFEDKEKSKTLGV